MASQNENLDIVAILDAVAGESVSGLIFELSSEVSYDPGDREGIKMLNVCDSSTSSPSEEGTSKNQTPKWQSVEDEGPCATLRKHFLSETFCSETCSAGLKSPLPVEANRTLAVQRVPYVFQHEMQPASQQPACQKEADSKQTKKKQRWMFSKSHKQELEAAFKENVYPSKWRLTELSENLAIPLPTLRVWFQNKRWRLRKNSDTSSTPSMNRSRRKLKARTKELKMKILPPDKKPYFPKCAGLSGVGPSSEEDNAGSPLTSSDALAWMSSYPSTVTSSGLTQAVCVQNDMPSENRDEDIACNLNVPSVKEEWNAAPFYWPHTHFPFFPISPHSSPCSYPLPMQPNSSVSSAKSSVSGFIPPAYSRSSFPLLPAVRSLTSVRQSVAADPTSDEQRIRTESRLPSALFHSHSLSSCGHVCLGTSCLHAPLPMPNALSSWSLYASPFSGSIPLSLVLQHPATESNQPSAVNSSGIPNMLGWGMPPIPASFFPAFSTSAGNMLHPPPQAPPTATHLLGMQCHARKKRADAEALLAAVPSSLTCALPSSYTTEASRAGAPPSSSCQREDLFASFSSESEGEN